MRVCPRCFRSQTDGGTIRQMTSDLEDASRLSIMGEMAAGVAHELHQPLAAIANYANGCKIRLQQGTFQADDGIEVMKHMASAAIGARSTIAHIKDFVQKQGFEKAVTDRNDVVRDATALAKFELKKHNVELVLELSENISPAWVDRTRISQVVLNLVLNGIDAIASSGQPERMLYVESRADGDRSIQVTVADSGNGVLPENRETIFDQFHTTKPQGLGLGLSISRSIVENHDGQLWCMTSAGRGGIFQFTVPTITAAQSFSESGIAKAG